MKSHELSGQMEALAAAAPAVLPNLGPVSAQMLARAGIGSVGELRTLGAVDAYRRVKRFDGRASLNLLWALAGALSTPPRPWQQVAREDRLSLLLQLEQAENAAGPGVSRPTARRRP